MSEEPHVLLDHVELRALTDPDKNSSASELSSELKVTGSSDAISEDEFHGTLMEYRDGILDAVFTEAEYRINACGEPNYPFSLEGKALVSKDNSFSTVYTFLLFLSLFGEDAVTGVNGAKLFEDVCAYATATYFGCQDALAETYVFGFPRRIEPKGFVTSLADLCDRRILEGEADAKFPGASTKDASLDIVAWLPFPDRRSGKLIAFGQCATGQYWWGKRTELNPGDWIRAWLKKTPQVVPVKMFFVPHAIDPIEWAQLGYAAGIIFDRFRITFLAEQSVPHSLRAELQRWSTAAGTQ